MALLPTMLLATACAHTPVAPPDGSVFDEPSPDQVEAVVFLVGDAGEVDGVGNPVLQSLANEVERWSGALARDSAVTVLFLGDNVYPSGYHDALDDDVARDSVRLGNEIATVSGPSARAYETQGIFIPGNHDWANTSEPLAQSRLKNLEARLDRDRGAGPAVQLLPQAGSAGPTYVDFGPRIRLVMIDTQWWLAEGRNETAIAEANNRLADLLADSRDRDVVVAAHHPLATGGEHGGAMSFWSTLGVRWLLNRTGAVSQDLSSQVYQDMISGLRNAFTRGGTPLVYASGHDHNLQVIRGTEPGDPVYTLVSGSASKLTSGLIRVPGMDMGLAAPGYMRLTFLRDGGVDLAVVSGPPSFTACPEGATPAHDCLTLWPTTFRTVYSRHLKTAP
jgi:hypothetical protein